MFQKDKLTHLLDAPVSKPDPFTLPHIIAWLETMPADGTYVWSNCNGKCLFHLYGEENGLVSNANASAYLQTTDRIGDILHAGIAVMLPHTFGAALIRARAYAAKVSV